MKDLKLVIVFVLSVFVLRGSTKKVCILHQQKIISTSITVTEESISKAEEISNGNEETINVTDGVDTLTEEIAIITNENEPNIISNDNNVEIANAEAEDEPNVISNNSNNVEIFAAAALVAEEISTSDCVLEGITLFADQNDILRRLCAITGAAHSVLHIVTVQNGTVRSDLPLATLCAEGPKGLLTWISWQDFVEKVRPLVDAEELPQLVIRNSSISVPTESENQDDPFSEVLIEMLPIGYKLFDTKPSSWNNVTFIKEIFLGSTELVNPNKTDAHIEGSISYRFPVQTNTTFLSSYPINGLPVEVLSDEPNNFIVGSTNKYSFNSTFFVERLVPAFKTETVSLNGTWGLHEYDIEGTIVSIFGYNADGTTIEESHTISARVVTLGASKIKDSYQLGDYTTTGTETNELTTIEELPIAIPIKQVDGQAHPGFRSVFYVASVLFFGTVTIVMIDVGKKLMSDRRERLRGREPYRKVDPLI